MSKIINIINEEIDSIMNDEVQQYIDIIDIDPNNPKYNKYIGVLKDKYNFDYVRPEVRYADEIKLVDKLNGFNKTVETSKGLKINLALYKTPNILKSLTIDATYDYNIVGSVGFSVDLKDKTLRIGGANVSSEYRRMGVYTEIIKVVLGISKKYGLKLIETGRSEDAKNFWKNSGNDLINEYYPPDPFTPPQGISTNTALLGQYGSRIKSIS